MRRLNLLLALCLESSSYSLLLFVNKELVRIL